MSILDSVSGLPLSETEVIELNAHLARLDASRVASMERDISQAWIRQNQWVRRNPFSGGMVVIETEHGFCTRHYHTKFVDNKPVVTTMGGMLSLVGHRLTYKLLYEMGYIQLQPSWRNRITGETTSLNPNTVY